MLFLIKIFIVLKGLIFGIERSIGKSFYFGFRCFVGLTPNENARDDDTSREIHCGDSMYLIIGYVIATFAILASINIVLQYSGLIVSRAVSTAIFAAFVVLSIYDLHESASEGFLGGKIGIFDYFAIIILITGMEIYGRDPEPDVEIITQYSHSATSSEKTDPEAETDHDEDNMEMIRKFTPIKR
jgi:hypothetical protein